MALEASDMEDDSITLDNTTITTKVDENASATRSTWHMASEMQHMRDRDEQGGMKPRKLGVTWQNLTVKGISSEATFNENAISQFYPFHKGSKGKPMKTIIDNSYGCVKPGEMLLVLGRPGSGCTTLLNVLSNHRLGYEEITGDVTFGDMTAEEAKKYKGQIIMNTEEEIFYPTLSVGDTIDFAARMKVPYHLPPGIETAEQYAQHNKDFLLRSVGISHTASTKVGDAYVRGVSGGERKRVSILESMTTRASVFCWDNSTRGLDASTALEWIKAVRVMTDLLGLTTIVTLYQAGNGIYEHFDKVLVLDNGKQMFYGPQMEAIPFMENFCWDNSTRGLDASTALEWIKAVRVMTDLLGLTTIVTLYQAGNGIYEHFDKVLVLDNGKQMFYGPQMEAIPFMENLGFMRVSGSNRADFLTGVTVPTERRIAPGSEKKFPRSADEVVAAYGHSEIKPRMLNECRDYPASEEAKENTANFREMVAYEKHRMVSESSPFTTNFSTQVKAAVIRQYQIMLGDKSTLIMKQVATIIQALLGGSLFYSAPSNSAGLFLKGGALFFSILYNSLIALSEVTDSFTGRPILAKHRSFALYHPAAICIAQVVADFPVLLFQVTHFGLVLYFMVGLESTPKAFFTYWITNFVTAMTMTSLFRLIGAAFPTFDAATKVSGLTVVALFVYTGYMITKPEMHPWFVWIFWINPMAYGFDALLSNEFHKQEIPCVGPYLIPSGPGYTDGIGGQSCAGVGGATPGFTSLTGDEYLNSMSFSHSHIWRNIGVICGFWVLFVAATIFFTSRWKLPGEGGRSLLLPREQQHKSRHLLLPKDEEIQATEKSPAESNSNMSGGSVVKNLDNNKSIFTWKNLTYTVKTSEGDRVLLDNVQGYVKPGMMGALMGSSGAGKTTLLDVLAQRKTEGSISGSVLVDGRPIPISFQRSAGYVEQLDIHESLATVREALEFSALLRQSRDTPDKEKLQYVDTIIDLLELNDLEHTLVGRPSAGLSVEQRKRLTIAVELVAKPSILIFLDEPTSGLDGQAAFNTVRFLQKLAKAGQAVLVTIHQPSAQLFAQFDTLLLLTTGGRTVYFGEIGDEASTVKDYFARHGASCP
ncbi:hypothetical protein V501_00332, partial [Pseudogymnoascus sp. VKM F-4519 (FW-2642)]